MLPRIQQTHKVELKVPKLKRGSCMGVSVFEREFSVRDIRSLGNFEHFECVRARVWYSLIFVVFENAVKKNIECIRARVWNSLTEFECVRARVWYSLILVIFAFEVKRIRSRSTSCSNDLFCDININSVNETVEQNVRKITTVCVCVAGQFSA